LFKCGLEGSPPLREWVYGTGIAYVIIGLCFSIGAVLLACTVIGLIPLLIILLVTPFFLIAWSIVGGVTLWKYGWECINVNLRLWQMGMAAEIISLILVFCMFFAAKKSKDQDE
jgi:sorbitol-specific phosphotransferase system component IIC